jgi:hypothetical protein
MNGRVGLPPLAFAEVSARRNASLTEAAACYFDEECSSISPTATWR